MPNLGIRGPLGERGKGEQRGALRQFVTRGKSLTAVPAGTLPPHNRHTFRTWALCALAILVCLVAPGVALGSNGDDAAPAGANEPQTATTGSSSGSDASTTGTNTSTTQSTPVVESPAVTPDASPESAGNANGNGNGSGTGTPTANAAPPTPTPDPAPSLPSNGNGNGDGNGNDPNTTNGQGNGNNQANSVGDGVDPNQNNGTNNGNSDHAANANANANSSQDKPKNVNVDVRVGQPGDNGAVAQGNNSTAAAAAGASGGSSGAGAAQQTAAGSTDSSGSDAGPNGAAALAPSQADSTGGETIPVANSPPCSESASNPAATGSAGTATTASTGASTPTVLNTSPSASCVNGASPDPQTGAGGGANGSSNPQATNVTGGSAPFTAPNSGQAPGVTPDYSASNGQIVITLHGPSDDAVDASTPGDGTSSTTIGPDDGTDGTAPNPVPDVTITAPAPTGSSSVDSANASGTSTQVQPTNINASVRILSPGDNGQVSQSNDSSAVAAAGAQGTDPTALPEATSTQVDPHNVNVSIRVGSPGDDLAITQTNTSTATATPVDPASIEAATVDLPSGGPNSAADVQNVSGIIQDLTQCPEESTCLPSSAPDPAGASSALAAADQSTANATQQAPSNVSVSIRVASPGMDGIVNQLNGANADGATTVTTTTDPENVVVGVVVPGDPDDVRIPDDPSVPWNWIWSWTTGTAPLSPDATPISSPDWNWIWTNPADATTTATPATDTAVAPATPGQWTWTWVWTRGDGWTTTWTYSQPCSCTWNWIWTWNWPAATQASLPNTAPAQIPAPPSDPQVVQTNNSSAAAAALTTFSGQQTSVASTDGDPGLATDYQGITSDQNALATADAAQVRPLNLSVVTGGWIEKLTQANDTVAAASAAAFDTAIQSVTQNQTGTSDGALHAADAAQVIATAQNATASAQSVQADAANVVQVWSQIAGNQAEIGQVSQRNQAVTAAYAAVASETTQIIDQSQIGGGAEQLATALQAAIITQAHQAAVGVAQAHVKNRATIEIPWNGLWNPPIDQSNDVSAVAVSTAYSGISQTIVQEESGDGIAWDEHAVQTAIVIQSGSASGGASQSFRENVAGWNGTVASGAPSGGNEVASELASVNAALTGPNGLIVGTPPLPAGGVLAGHVVYVSHASGRAVLVRSPWAALPAGTRNATAAGTPGTPADRGGATSGSTPYRHLLLNLLGAMSSTLGVFFGTTPFAALLALFMIAALGVGRLQYPVPALGRSADFARRERPG